MKIGIDIRTFSKTSPQFCQEFLTTLAAISIGNEFCIYSDKDFSVPESMQKITNEKFSQIWGQETAFLKQLKSDSCDTVVTFEESFPIWYKERVFSFASSLEHIFYPDVEKESFWKKHTRWWYLKKLLEKSQKIIAPTVATKKELNERLNIPEDKIEIITPFFTQVPHGQSMLDVKMKLGITGHYFVYDYPHQHNNNFKRTLQTLQEIRKKYQIFLVVLGSENAANREARDQVRELGLDGVVYFVGQPSPEELKNYYTQSIGVWYPIAYDNFPTTLGYAFSYNVPILASNNAEIQTVFGNSILYFSPLSVGSMMQTIEGFLTQSQYVVNYEAVRQKYHPTAFCQNLFPLIV